MLQEQKKGCLGTKLEDNHAIISSLILKKNILKIAASIVSAFLFFIFFKIQNTQFADINT